MRARNLKPSFYKNEQLAKLPPLTRILFTGLWCMADREGRLEDRPERIKVEILPYDKCNVNAMLDALLGFIWRYKVDGVAYIQVVNFKKHQRPHIRELESIIPKIPKTESTTQVVLEAQPKSGRPDLDVPFPLSLNPIPPSPTPEYLNPGSGASPLGDSFPAELKNDEPDILDWLAYKRERGETYKARGLKALWTKLLAIPAFMRKAALQTAMANNWAGFFPAKSNEDERERRNREDVKREDGQMDYWKKKQKETEAEDARHLQEHREIDEIMEKIRELPDSEQKVIEAEAMTHIPTNGKFDMKAVMLPGAMAQVWRERNVLS